MKGTIRTNDVIVPYVGMDRVVKTIQTLHKESAREAELRRVADLLGCTISSINNITPTLCVLGLAETKDGKLTLTTDGLAFAEAYSLGQEDKAKKIARDSVEKSEVLKFVKSLLEARTQLSGEEIGRALSERFNRNWKDIRTYRAHGNSCASIIAFAGLGFYDRGVLSSKPVTQTTESVAYSPEIGYNSILGLLKALNIYNRAKISDIAEKLNKDEKALWAFMTVCTKLNLVKKEIQGVYSITDFGRKLIDPTAPQKTKIEIFRGCLLDSPYGEIIKSIAVSENEMTLESIGDTLSYQLRRDWSPQTKKLYAKKFVTWLSAADLITKVQRGLYKINKDKLKTLPKTETKKQNEIEPDYDFIFAVGRSIGSLESLLVENRDEVFRNRISELKSLLRQHDDLHMLLDMLQKNYELAVSSNNPPVFSANMSFVRQKIKDKLNLSNQEVGT
jgi:hypothetical protein